MDKNKLLYFLLIFSVLILIFGLNLNFKATNYDIFFHIKTGKYIIKSKSIPEYDVFSYTATDQEWIAHEYVPAIIFFFFYNNFGITSLIFLKAFILASLFFIMFKLVNNKNLYLALILTIFAAFSTKLYAYIRPHIFFWLFLVIMFFIFKHKKYFFLPILTLLWTNFHSSVIIGLIVITIYLLELFIKKRKFKFIFLIIGCFLTSLINPYTYKIFLLPFTILKFSNAVNEWRPYTIESFWFWFYLIFVLCIALIFILSHKKKVTHLLVFLLFVVLGFKSKRYVASSILVNLIIIQPYLDGIKKIKIKRTFNKDLFFLIIILLLIIFSIVNLNAFNLNVPWRYFGKNAIDFVKKNNIEGNMYNSYELGSPIIFSLYPQYKVFIDGRVDVYKAEMLDDYYDIRYGQNWMNLIEKYNILFFIVDNKAEIGKILFKDNNYSLVFFDEYYAVYIENIPKYENIRKFKYINPYYGLDPKKNTDNIINEIEYLLSLDPDNVNAYRNLGFIYYYEEKDNEKSLYYFDKYLEINPEDKEVKSLIDKIEK